MHVELVRGSIVESRHHVHVAVVEGAGTLVAHAGDPDLVTFMRSVAKPFQALPVVVDGAAERFGLSEEDLALCCASHSSEPAQVERVRAFLAKIGAAEADLLCGPHRPLSDAVAKDYETRGVRLTAIHSNCSGKHTGMLALARHHGWPTAGYNQPEHPVQQRCLEEVSRWTDVPADRMGRGTDGCSVVTFALPLRNMAWGWARLANAEFGMRNAELKPAGGLRIPHSALRIRQAMLAHPDLLSGAGRPCCDIMRAHPGRVIAKVGAEGVYAALLVREGWGVALKVEDGHSAAAVLAIAAVLEQLGLGLLPASLGARSISNSRGAVVGELRVRGEIAR